MSAITTHAINRIKERLPVSLRNYQYGLKLTVSDLKGNMWKVLITQLR